MSTARDAIRLHGLKQCDSCRDARRWLQQQSVAVEFVDLREQPPDMPQLEAWLAAVGEQVLVNRRSRTWRELTDDERLGTPVAELLRRHPTLIRRPVITAGAVVSAGGGPDQWQQLLDTRDTAGRSA